MSDPVNNPDLVAVYGTLRRRSLFQKLPQIIPELRFFGYGLIKGRIFWLGRFPGLILVNGVVQVEVYCITAASVWHELDQYEGFDPENCLSSLFLRQKVRLLHSGRLVWLYVLNHNIFVL